jgi:hypothetical protein
VQQGEEWPGWEQNLRSISLVELGPAGDTPDLCPTGVPIYRAIASGGQRDFDSIGDGFVPSMCTDAVARIPAVQLAENAVLIRRSVPINLPF